MSLAENTSIHLGRKALERAAAERRGETGLLVDADAALDAGDAIQARIILLAGLRSADVARWMAARIPKFIDAQMSDAISRRLVMAALVASDTPRSEKISCADAIIKVASSDDETRKLLRLMHKETREPRFSWRLVKVLIEAEELDAALMVLNQMAKHGHELALVHQFHAELLLITGKHAQSVEICQRLMDETPDRADYKRNYLRHLMAADRTEDLEQWLPQVLEAHPSDWMLAFFLHRARVSAEVLHRCFDILTPPDVNSDPRYCLHYAVGALAVGNLSAAEAAMQFEVPDSIAYARSFKTVVDQLARDRWVPSDRFVDDPSKTVQVVRAGANKPTIVICISNTGINFSFLSLGLVDSLLARYDVNVIYLRETRRMAFHSGIVGMGPDQAETLASIDRLHEELGSSKRIFLGCSLGGYGAARYAHHGDNDAVLSFAGATHLFEFTDLAIPKNLQAAQFLTGLQMRKSIPHQDSDLLPLIAASNVRHIHFHGEHEALDTGQAERISACSNVETHAVPEASDHFIFGYCVANGMLDQALRDVLE